MIVIFSSTIENGQMNKAFYPKEMSNDEKNRLMHEHKDSVVKNLGLCYKNIFMTNQKNTNKPDLYEDGLCYTLTRDDVNTYSDLFDYDVYADILKLTPETPNIALAHNIADCAVVRAVNMKTNEMTLSHCGGEYIDRYLAAQTVDALGGDKRDIRVYVSPFAYNLFYSDAANLKWANNKDVWNGFKHYEEKDGVTSVKIDIYGALKKQLTEVAGVATKNVYMSPYDTTTCDLFYSNSRGYNEPEFKGRFMSGIALLDDDKEVKENKFIKVIK